MKKGMMLFWSFCINIIILLISLEQSRKLYYFENYEFVLGLFEIIAHVSLFLKKYDVL